MDAHDVIVIGAGLAGLRCAAVLASAGLDVVVLEAGDAVGGRQRTDVVDGFRLDRGFQVLNPAYPAVGRAADVAALDLRHFPVAVRVRRDDRVVRLGHPLRHPALIPATLASGLVGASDLIALARWAGPAVLRPDSVKRRPDDSSLFAAWDRAGLRGPLRHEVLEPFLAGVLADDRGATSDAFVRLLVRSFALGRPGVPALGIGALPAQLAHTARAAGARIRLGHRAARIRSHAAGVRVGVAGVGRMSARSVVVAVGPEAVHRLTALPAPASRGLQTWWFEAEAESAPALLSVDGRRGGGPGGVGGGRRGPLVNTVVLSATAAEYAPPGRHLLAATGLLGTGPDAVALGPTEAEVRAQLRDVWGARVTPGGLLRRDDIRHALPAQSPPLRIARPVRLGDGVYVAGDHRDTASIQGALVSGERAARAVVADLSGRAPTA